MEKRSKQLSRGEVRAAYGRCRAPRTPDVMLRLLPGLSGGILEAVGLPSFLPFAPLLVCLLPCPPYASLLGPADIARAAILP